MTDPKPCVMIGPKTLETHTAYYNHYRYHSHCLIFTYAHMYPLSAVRGKKNPNNFSSGVSTADGA